MKRILLAAVLFAFAASAMAIPAKRGLWKTLRLADGSEVRAELRGDEFGHFWQTADGQAYAKDGDAYVLTSAAAVAEEAAAKRAAMVETGTTGKKRVTLGGSHDPYEGKKNCLVILVNFANKSFEADHDNAFFTKLCNEENFTDGHNIHSVHDYFYDQSYGKLDLAFDVAGPVQLQYNYEYYGGTSGSDNAPKMVLEACAGAEAEGVDFSKYDWDGDGEADEVFVLYAGYNAASYFDADGLVWPHMWYIEYSNETCPTYDGVKINTYACSSELSGDGLINGIGAMCHEFSHCLGLPDAYDTGSGDNFGMSFWSVMDSGCYNGSDAGYVPAGYTSYERMYCGWLTPTELTEETEVSGMKGLTEGGEAYIIYNKGTSKEYYLLENRSNYDYDAGLYGYGLLVLHIDFNSTVWSNNVVNTTAFNNDHERYTFIAADNDKSLTTTSLANDVYPSSGNNHLDNTSVPAATTYNLNTDASLLMNVSISNIAKADDGTISFRFYPAGSDPEHGNKPDGAVFYESFDYCSGAGGNDGNFGSGAGAGDFMPDNGDWTYNSAHGGAQCAMFGSNKQAANIVTPTFTIGGETVFSFNAAPYEALIPGVLAISVESGDATLSEAEFSIEQGAWTPISFTLDGEGDVSLRIKETSGIGRFFMDEAAAVPAEYAAIRTVESDAAEKHTGVYSLDGVRLGDDTSKLKAGIYIVDGKKCIIR